MNLQRAGGIAALFQALTYIVGFVAIATFLNPGDTANWSAVQKLAFVLERKAIFQIWTIFIYVAFGTALVVLAVALHERLRRHASALMQVATAFGLIWAGLVIASGMIASVGLDAAQAMHATDPLQAAAAWAVINAVHDGLGGGVEIVGGLWVLLASWAALRSNQLPKLLNWIGMLAGVAGLLTIAPPLGDLGIVFGLLQIPWFAWLGVWLLRSSTAT